MPDLDFAKRLTTAMTDARINQAELAKRLGVTQPTVSRWLSGSVPQMLTSVALCKELGVSDEWLIFGIGKESPLDFTDAMRRRLVEARKRDGKTQEETVRASAYTVAQLDAVEKGNAIPDRRMLAVWLDSLGVSEEWVFKGSGEMFVKRPAYVFIPPWDIEKSKDRAKALREQAAFLISQAERLEWEIEQSEQDFKKTGRPDLRLLGAERRRTGKK